MSIFGNILKVAGTVVECAGKTIVDCVDVIEKDMKEYKESEGYVKAEARREELRAEMKDNWNKFKANNKDYLDTFKRDNK